jgi:hypothetical protein
MTTERDPVPTNQPSPDESPTQAWTPPPAPMAPATGTATETPSAAAPAVAVTRTGDSRVRWGVALLVVALIIGVGAATVFLLTGAQSSSKVIGHVPGDSTLVYGEMRLDLPGDQRQKLGEFLSKFPGFQDQATLDVKIDDVLDRFIRSATDGSQDWTTNIKPWFDGQAAIAVPKIPTGSGDAPENGRFLLLLAVKDEAKARAWLDEVLAETTTTTADHNGTLLTYIGEGANRGAAGIAGGKVLLVGDVETVEAAVDTNGAGKLADNAQVKAARASLDGDGLGFIYYDLAGLKATLAEVAAEAAEEMPIDPTALELVPDWLIMRVQARGDGIAMEMALPHVEAAGNLENRAGRLAPHLPASTIALLDIHDAGPAIKKALDEALADPNADAEIESMLSFLGGVDGIVGWMGDAGLAVTRTGTQVDAGLVFSSTDQAKANGFLGSVRNSIALFGSSMGFEARDEDYAGTTITTLDFGPWESLAALFGGMSPVPGGTPGDLPIEGNLELSFATTSDLTVLAIGDTFVKSVLDAGARSSLAENERYQALLGRVGAENTSTVFLDITALREMVEGVLAQAPEALTEYEREVKPYLLPLDAFIQASVRDGDLDRSTGIVVVK